MRFLVATLFAVAAAAQGTYIVDIANGPGTSFTQIQAAVQAVPSGSTLVVRAGTYAPVDITAKGVAILCDANVTVASASQPYLRIANTLPTQSVVVERLRPATGTLGARIDAANGPVVLEGGGLVLQATLTASAFGPTVVVGNSRQVMLRNMTILGGVSSGPSVANGIACHACVITDSTVAFENCTVVGMTASSTLNGFSPGRPGIEATNSRILLTDCVVTGGNGMFGPPPIQTPGGAAILGTTCDLHVRGGAQSALNGGVAPGFGPFPPIQHPAVAGTGNLWIDAAILLTGAIEPSMTTTTTARPRLTSSLGTIGGTADARRDGPAGVFSVIACSLPGITATVPPFVDPIWLDGGSLFVAVFGIAPANGLTASLGVPNQPSLTGFALAWQAADWGPSGIAAFSNPSLTFVH